MYGTHSVWVFIKQKTGGSGSGGFQGGSSYIPPPSGKYICTRIYVAFKRDSGGSGEFFYTGGIQPI